MKKEYLKKEREVRDNILIPILKELYNIIPKNATATYGSIYLEISRRTHISFEAIKSHFGIITDSSMARVPNTIAFLKYLKLFDKKKLNQYIDNLDTKEKLHAALDKYFNASNYTLEEVAKYVQIDKRSVLNNKKTNGNGTVPPSTTFLLYCELYKLPIMNEIVKLIPPKNAPTH